MTFWKEITTHFSPVSCCHGIIHSQRFINFFCTSIAPFSFCFLKMGHSRLIFLQFVFSMLFLMLHWWPMTMSHHIPRVTLSKTPSSTNWQLCHSHWHSHYLPRFGKVVISVTRLGNLLHFGQLFNAVGSNYFAQITHIFRQFSKR